MEEKGLPLGKNILYFFQAEVEDGLKSSLQKLFAIRFLIQMHSAWLRI